jgi:hypothetical protein
LNGSGQDDYTKHDPSGDPQIPYLGAHPRAGLDVRDQMLAVVEQPFLKTLEYLIALARAVASS